MTEPQPVGPKVCRPGRPWTREKLGLLRYYLGGTLEHPGGFMVATRGARGRHYIDLFSGPGQCQMSNGEIVDGSPLIAARGQPPFTSMFWVESDARNAASLREHRRDFPNRRIEVIQSDANAAIDGILRQVPGNEPVFAFLDPEGSELDWETIEKLSRHKREPKIELFLLFAYNMAVVRLLPRDPSKLRHADRLDHLMPDRGGWRRIYTQRAESSPDRFRRLVLDEYLRGLRQLGYRHVLPPKLIPTPQWRPLYFMIFATDHSAGLSIMDSAYNRVEEAVQQPTFLPYDQRY